MDIATEQHANMARFEYEDALIAKGAHKITVEQVAGKGNVRFSVIAWVDPAKLDPKKKSRMPTALDIEHQGKAIHVPLVVREGKQPRI